MRMSGFSVLVFLSACTAFPGIAPTYVLRWPFSSATSDSPPTENRKNLRSSAFAIDFAMLENLLTSDGEMRCERALKVDYRVAGHLVNLAFVYAVFGYCAFCR